VSLNNGPYTLLYNCRFLHLYHNTSQINTSYQNEYCSIQSLSVVWRKQYALNKIHGRVCDIQLLKLVTRKLQCPMWKGHIYSMIQFC